jgi:hypothetical protein
MLRIRKTNILPLFTQDIILDQETNYFFLHIIFVIVMFGLLFLFYFHNKIEWFIYINIVALVGVIIYHLRYRKPTHLSV